MTDRVMGSRWQDVAECRGMDTGDFFPGGDTVAALAACGRCEVRAECLAADTIYRAGRAS